MSRSTIFTFIALTVASPLIPLTTALACPQCPGKQCQLPHHKDHSTNRVLPTAAAQRKKDCCTKKQGDTSSCPKTGPAVCAHPPMPPCPAGKVCIQVMPKARWFANECEVKNAGAFIAKESACRVK